MDSNNDDDAFKHFCVKNLIEFNNETDDAKKAHFQRKINAEMYHEACARKLPKPVIASMVHKDLITYSEFSANVFASKFDRMLCDLAIGASDWKCTLDESTLTHSQMKGKYLEGANDDITEEEIAMLFDKNEFSARCTKMDLSNNSSSAPTINQYKNDDDDEALTFNLNSSPRKNLESRYGETKNFPHNAASTSASLNKQNVENGYQSVSSWQNRQNFANNKRKCDANDNTNKWKQSNLLRNINLNDERERAKPPPIFKTAQDELEIRYEKKYGSNSSNQANGTARKTLGGRRTITSPFISPFVQQHDNPTENDTDVDTYDNNDKLKHIDPKLIEMIRSEIMNRFEPIVWEDIAGLEYAKSIIKEAVVWPILRPDIFTGLRRPPRAILLHGPPGTGKTLIGKCIASQSKSTFFSISASSLTSKYVGEGEKMVRTLFAVAVVHQPSVIFIDEIDSLLCQRSESEHESSRRVKTEFLVQLDGACTGDSERILIVGATNRPQELDEAARRRFTKRLYIPLPEQTAREELMRNLLKNEHAQINDMQIVDIAKKTDGFSGADLKVLCQEASMGPIRSIPVPQMSLVNVNDVRAFNYGDFQAALQCVKASVSPNDLKHYIEWDKTYGSGAGK